MYNAICMLIFGNIKYLIGGCLSAYMHKSYIKKLDLDIKIVVMVDNLIYKYKEELLFFFDEVFLIDLFEIKIGKEYFIYERYSKWIKYSINKWQLLNFTQFNKILFLDVDVLPINKNFYNIFNFNTPAVLTNNISPKLDNKKIMISDILYKNNFDINNFCCTKIKLKRSIDGSLLLIKPNKKLFVEYFDFIKICDDKGGWNAFPNRGIDETSILLFLMFFKKIDIYHVSTKYIVKICYTSSLNSYAFDYTSEIKPWTKLPFFQWDDEYIWNKIIKKAFINRPVLTNIYLKLLIKELIKFSIDHKDCTKCLTKYYENNEKSLTNLNSSIKTKKLIDYIIKNQNYLMEEINNENSNFINNKKIKQIIKYSQYIHSLMNK